jgi:hypothetical protein
LALPLSGAAATRTLSDSTVQADHRVRAAPGWTKTESRTSPPASTSNAARPGGYEAARSRRSRPGNLRRWHDPTAGPHGRPATAPRTFPPHRRPATVLGASTSTPGSPASTAGRSPRLVGERRACPGAPIGRPARRGRGVKALRKPKAVAWALDAGVADPDAVADLTRLSRPCGRHRRRCRRALAIARLRTPRQRSPTRPAAACGHGHPVDPSTLAAGLRAVVGDPRWRNSWPAGWSTLPAAGGLGMALPSGPTTPPGADAAGPGTAPRSAGAAGRGRMARRPTAPAHHPGEGTHRGRTAHRGADRRRSPGPCAGADPAGGPGRGAATPPPWPRLGGPSPRPSATPVAGRLPAGRRAQRRPPRPASGCAGQGRHPAAARGRGARRARRPPRCRGTRAGPRRGRGQACCGPRRLVPWTGDPAGRAARASPAGPGAGRVPVSRARRPPSRARRRAPTCGHRVGPTVEHPQHGDEVVVARDRCAGQHDEHVALGETPAARPANPRAPGRCAGRP